MIATIIIVTTAATIPPISPPGLLGDSDDVGISLTGDTKANVDIHMCIYNYTDLYSYHLETSIPIMYLLL